MTNPNQLSETPVQLSGACCPPFLPDKWEEKTHYWERKKFIMDSIPTFFHIPLPAMIKNRIMKMIQLAGEANALEGNKQDVLLLFTDPHAFRSEIYLSVTKQVPGANNRDISGTFVSKVFDGPYQGIPKFMKQMNAWLANSDLTAKRYFVHYAYCPNCAKEVGANHIVLFAELGSEAQ